MPNSLFNLKSVNRFFFSFKLTAVVIIVAACINIYSWLVGNMDTIFTGYIINPLATMKIITSISFILLGSIYFTDHKKIVSSLIFTGIILQIVEFLLIIMSIDMPNYWALSSPITLIMFCLGFLAFYFVKVKPLKNPFLFLNGILYVLSTFAVFSYLLDIGELNSYIGFETLSWNTSILFFMNSISLFEFKLVKIIDTLQLKNIALQKTHPYKYYPLFFLVPILLISTTSIFTYFSYLTILDSAFIIILFLSASSFINMFVYSCNFIKYYTDIHEKSIQLEVKNQELTVLNKELKSLNKAINKKKAYLEDFATITSHSLREPIVALGELKKITDCTPLEEGFPKEQLNNMYLSAIQRLNSGINSLTNYHKFIKSEYKVHKPEITLSKSIQNTYKSLKNLKPEGTVLDLDITADPLLPAIHIDNILENLFTNSFKFRNISQPLNIKIIAYKTKDYYKILFRDNGIGIDLTAHKEAVFKKGKRFHYQSNTYNGYGLFFVKLYVTKLHGKIAVFSEPGTGTAFRIVIKIPHE